MPSILKPTYSEELPIHARREEIIRAIKDNQIVVIAGETGSGKTTQIPKFLIDAGYGQNGLIGCTQPRRVAALSVAQRIAEELGVTYGNEVGAKIRFTDQTRHDTAIKVMTDGILLNEIQDDPMLRAYDAIIIDEAHERSLNIDFILGCLRQLSDQRKDLKIIITSATIDTEAFSKAFDGAPIIEVSGRMFPVDMIYRPFDENEGDLTFIEAASETINEILYDNRQGDILVFLPGERDIHELRRELEDSPARSCDILSLYGRMANADQQRIFHPQGRRRIILSTNIAETSLTVPGIRYVVDTGLARISRYSATSRTQRLPIEPIAQSSADQRKGRCGRVSNGVCYRLYSEQDFLGRPRFTTPEIHRSNLASVILRMLAFRLGDIRSFPFIDPPSDTAIRGGYRLLEELDAVYSDHRSDNEDDYRLTKLGRRLAQLPVDPTVARMLLQAHQENAIEDVLVIASGLSIQDPRERPAELAKEADEMQKRFVHKESDFLTILNIWNAYHDEMERLTQAKLRKFCKQHFVSYQRMREWREVHHQLERILKKLKLLPVGRDGLRVVRDKANTPKEKKQKPNSSASKLATPLDSKTDAGYAAIHRSILTGLLSNIAVKEEEHNYRGPRNRKALLFPGSGLFDHETAKKQRKASYAKTSKPKPAKTTAPAWIVCGEWMETSRLFARTAAKVKVEWIEEMAGDLLKLKHSEPFWSTKSAAALCKQRKVLFGLEIGRSNVSLSRIDPEQSTDIFVRNGLIELGIRERPDFLKHNAEVAERAESELARRRLGSGFAVEDRLYDFYRQHLTAVGSYAELRSFAKREHKGSLDFLNASIDDLLPEEEQHDSTEAFPKSLAIGGSELPLRYRHEPGGEDDGVTLHVPLTQIGAIQQGTLDWAVPGHLEEKIESLLRGLPKQIRIQLHPLKERAAQLRQQLKPSARSLRDQLADTLREQYQIQTFKDDWSKTEIPNYLQPRIQIENTKGDILADGRNLDALRASLEATAKEVSSGNGLDAIPAWQQATAQYERENLNSWNFGDLPQEIDLSGDSGLPLKAYPALVKEGESVHLRLLPDADAALEATRHGWPALATTVMGRDIAWLRNDLKDLKQLGALLLPLGSFDIIKANAWSHLQRHLFRCGEYLPLKESRFKKGLVRADEERRGIVPKLCDQLRAHLDARQAISLLLEQKKTAKAILYPGMRAQLESISPTDVLEHYSFAELPDLTRFLKAMRLRAERAKDSIQRDIEKSKRVAPYETRSATLSKLAKTAAQKNEFKAYRILLEEFKVSVYAQELGTAQKVSEKRLDKLADDLERELK
ncbi:MAG: ATP-dependent helicase HrpA [Lentimonas sp.]|jgi:ATP-dependent helicase HrpA